MKPKTKTIVIIAASVAAIALAAWLWYACRRRRLTQAITLGGTGEAPQGDIITGAVQSVTDAIKTTLGMQYFTISELCASTTARKRGIDNTPTAEARANLETLITQCLDPIRRIYGKPIIVTSGYRCPALNAAVGGSSTSQHMSGQAADLVPASGGSLNDIFRAAVSFGNFDQLIIEQSGSSRWVHVSYGPRHRHAILAYRNGTYTNITNSWESYLA